MQMKKFLLQWLSFKNLPAPSIEFSNTKDKYVCCKVSVAGCDHIAQALNKNNSDAEECACQAYLMYLIWKKRLLSSDLPESSFKLTDDALPPPENYTKIPPTFFLKVDSKTSSDNRFGWTVDDATSRVKEYVHQSLQREHIVLQQWVSAGRFMSSAVIYCAEIKTWICGMGTAGNDKDADSLRFVALANILSRYGAIESRIESSQNEIDFSKIPNENSMVKLPVVTHELFKTYSSKYDIGDCKLQFHQYITRTKQNLTSKVSYVSSGTTGVGTAKRSICCVEKNKWLLATSHAKDIPHGSANCSIALAIALHNLGVLTVTTIDIPITKASKIELPANIDEEIKKVLCESGLSYPFKPAAFPNNRNFDLIKGAPEVGTTDTSSEAPSEEYSLNSLDRDPVKFTGQITKVVNWSPPTAVSKPWPKDNYIESNLHAASIDLSLSAEANASIDSPLTGMKDSIINTITNNPVTLVVAKTISGSASEMPQYILNKYTRENRFCNILVCNAYELTARLLALQVAAQRGESLGASIGYGIPNETVTPKCSNSIFYCTSRILLNILGSVQGLQGISHVVVTDVHNNDLKTDLILALLRDTICKFPDFRLILTSAVQNNTRLINYFDCVVINGEAKVKASDINYYFASDILQLLGDSAAVQTEENQKYSDDSSASKSSSLEYKFDDNGRLSPLEQELDLAQFSSVFPLPIPSGNSKLTRFIECKHKKLEQLIKYLADQKVDGAILVFMGTSVVPQWFTYMSTSIPNIEVVPLYKVGLHQATDQIFAPPNPEKTRVIFCGNIGETSIPLPYVSHVINFIFTDDIAQEYNESYRCLISKERFFLRMNKIIPSGNTASYYCFCSRPMFDSLSEKWPAQSQYSSLTDHLLLVHQLQAGNIRDVLASTLNPPPESFVVAAEQDLKEQSILDSAGTLTPLGQKVVRLGMEPTWGRFIIYGCIFGIGDPCAKIAATVELLKHQSICYNCYGPKRHLWEPYLAGHTLDLLKTVVKFEDSIREKKSKDFCQSCALVENSMHRIRIATQKIQAVLRADGFPASCFIKHSFSFDNLNFPIFGIIRALFLYVNYPRVYKSEAETPKTFTCISNPNRTLISGGMFMRYRLTVIAKTSLSLTSIFPIHILLFCTKKAVSKGNFVLMDYDLATNIDGNAALRILAMRRLLFNVLEKCVKNPAIVLKPHDKKVINVVSRMCTVTELSDLKGLKIRRARQGKASKAAAIGAKRYNQSGSFSDTTNKSRMGHQGVKRPGSGFGQGSFPAKQPRTFRPRGGRPFTNSAPSRPGGYGYAPRQPNAGHYAPISYPNTATFPTPGYGPWFRGEK